MNPTNQTAGAVVDAPAIADASAAVANDAAEVTQADGNTEGQTPDLAAEVKKLQNALNKQNRRIGTLTAREKQALRELQAVRDENAKFKQPQGQAASTGRPKEEDFPGDYAAFLRADAAFIARDEAQKHISEREAKNKETAETEEQQAWEDERDALLDANSEVAAQSFPDFANVMNENLDDIKNIAPHVKRAFLEADSGAFALYHLAKEGKLDALNSMSPYQVAMVVARAEDKAVTASKAKPVTQAPAPITASRGGGTAGTKNLAKLDAKDLLEEISNMK